MDDRNKGMTWISAKSLLVSCYEIEKPIRLYELLKVFNFLMPTW